MFLLMATVTLEIGMSKVDGRHGFLPLKKYKVRESELSIRISENFVLRPLTSIRSKGILSLGIRSSGSRLHSGILDII